MVRTLLPHPRQHTAHFSLGCFMGLKPYYILPFLQHPQMPNTHPLADTVSILYQLVTHGLASGWEGTRKKKINI